MISFYGFLFISIIGSILHFTYDLSNHNKYGFMVDGLHYITRTNLDPRGFDINGIWHRKEGNHYISTGSIFDDNGFTIEGKTLRTDKVTGKKYYDIVNDMTREEIKNKLSVSWLNK